MVMISKDSVEGPEEQEETVDVILQARLNHFQIARQMMPPGLNLNNCLP